MSGILDLNGLLSTIYGSSSGTSSSVSTDPLGDLTRAETNSTKDIAQTAAEPQVAKDIATFRSAVASAKTPAQLLQNPTVLKVLLTANGLGDQTSYTALAQKALLSDTTDTSSLADQLPNTAWKATAATFDFANSGLSIIQNTSVLDTVANGYAEVLWRQSLDTNTPGLSNALTFRSEASTITSVDQVLADSTLRSVVLTALGIPAQIAYQDIGARGTGDFLPARYHPVQGPEIRRAIRPALSDPEQPGEQRRHRYVIRQLDPEFLRISHDQ